MRDEKKMALASALVAMCLGLLSVPLLAHHGTNISYDRTTTVTIKGVVSEFWYRNPHPALFIDVKDEDGESTRWAIEIAPTPYTLALRGWNKRRSDEALTPGTPVSVKIYPARAGTPVGLLQGIANEEGAAIFGEVSGRAEGPAPELPPSAPSARFDPRDFSGVWLTDHSSTNGFRSMTEEEGIPPRTPWAQEVYLSRKTARPHEGKEAVEPAFGNDPIMMCNPKGLLRLFMYTNPAEFIHTASGDRILMTFQSQGSTRSIWMDGRALPVDPEPRWNGYSVGRWEGDTLVIDTIGFDDRAWLDQYGNVYSTDMRLEERWRRVDPDTLEAEYRIDDPTSYTRPWVSTTKVWKRQPYELREEFCAPMDELQFNEMVRDPAAGVVSSQ